MLRHRRRCLDRALEGLGEHGMVEVETSPLGVEEVSSELLPLLPALRVELDRMISNCKITLHKLNRTARTLTRHELDMSPSSTLKRANIFSFESNKNENAFELQSECNHQHVLHYTTTNIQVTVELRSMDVVIVFCCKQVNTIVVMMEFIINHFYFIFAQISILRKWL